MKTTIHGLLVFSVLCFCISAHAAVRETATLDGTWTFSTDPNAVGEKEAWFKPGATMLKMPLKGYSPKANGTIQVPGIWTNQGYGDPFDKTTFQHISGSWPWKQNGDVPTDMLKHQFIGKGWYKRTFTLPSTWRGQNIFVVLGGISRYAKIWVNGQSAGPEAIGCIGPHERDITSLVRFGDQNDITICVDSKQRYEIDTLYACSSMADFLQLPWGGLWGHVTLEARPTVCLDGLYLRGNIHNSTCTAETTILADKPIDKELTLQLSVFDSSGKCVAQGKSPIKKAGEKIAVTATIPSAELWSPEAPTLYNIEVSLLHKGNVIDRVKDRFGLRELKYEGEKILLNGKRIFLAGIGDDHVFPNEFSMPSDKQLYLKRLKMIKSFGFNHVRNHSTMMPDEFYQACDELGIISTCEFLIVYRKYIPGSPWVNDRIAPGTTPDAAMATYLDRFRAAVLQYRNHPSISWWVGGNELYDNQYSFTEGFKKIVDKLDPDRAFVLSDGCTFTDINAKYQPVRCAPFREEPDLFAMPNKYTIPKTNNVPVLAHEMGNYVTFPKLDQADLLAKTAFQPFWFVDGINILKKNGLYNETNQWVITSEKQYLYTHKYNVELLRRNDRYSGYHWWLFQDYWTTSNGIVDLFFRPKSYRPADILPFNSDVVLLLDGLKFCYRGGDKVQLTLPISNFSRDALTGELAFTVSGPDGVLKNAVYPAISAPCGGLNRPELLEWTCPDVDKPQVITIASSYKTDKRTYKNNWFTWVYPREAAQPKTTLTVYCDGALDFFPSSWSFSPIPDRDALPANAIYLTSVMNDKLIDAMNRGAHVVLFGSLAAIPNRPISWRSAYWQAGSDIPGCGNHTGTYVYPNSTIDAMVRDRWCDISWYELIQDSYKDIFTEQVPRPDILIRTIPSIIQPEDSSILYQVAVGKGKMIVSKLNHQKAKGLGTNDWLCTRLIELADTKAQPKAVWTARQFYQPVSAPNGWTVGYWQVKRFDKMWWPYPGCRSDVDRTTIVKQDRKANSLAWWTQPVAANPGQERSFIFAGSFGDPNEPKTDGFLLRLNYRPILRFDLPTGDDPASWKSDDGKCVLKFETKRKSQSVRGGLFVLTVPGNLVKDGEKQTISVHSLGEKSNRWFGLNPFVDF